MRAFFKGSQPVHAKSVFLAVLGVSSVIVILNAERFLIDPHDTEWAHIARFKWLLLAHGIAGMIALVTGPVQFSSRIRRARVKLHRVTGRIYVVAVAAASLIALYISAKFEPWPRNPPWIAAIAIP